jgi:hypothetical protein
MTIQGGFVSNPWYIYFRGENASLSAAPAAVIPPIRVSGTAAITTTPLPTEALAPGLYRVSVYLRITQAASVSSSATVTITWTDDGVACSYAYPAVTGNTVASVLVAPPLLLDVEQSSPVSYSVAYASVGGTSMIFKIAVVLERVSV